MLKLFNCPTYACVLDRFALEIENLEWSDFTGNAVNWGNALNRTANLVGPDVPVTSGEQALLKDLEPLQEKPLKDLDTEGVLGDGTETYRESTQILADLSDSPILVKLPGPFTLLQSLFGSEWTDFFTGGDLAAGDLVHESSQLVGDVLRELGEVDVGGVLVDDRGTSSLSSESAGDLFLDYGVLFNVADHFDLPLLGIYPREMLRDLVKPWENFQGVLADECPVPPSEYSDAWRGRMLPESIWKDRDPERFSTTVGEILEEIPQEGEFLLMGDLPRAAVPERVQQFKTLLAERRSKGGQPG